MANDTLAVGILRALQERQIAVPERVQLITFNDTAITRQVYPALSSISVYTEEMGQAMQLLDRVITSPTPHPRKIKLGTQLVIQEFLSAKTESSDNSRFSSIYQYSMKIKIKLAPRFGDRANVFGSYLNR